VVGVACLGGDREGGKVVWVQVDNVSQPWWGGKTGSGCGGVELVYGLLERERVEQHVPMGFQDKEVYGGAVQACGVVVKGCCGDRE
jgi:hypothetical protein